MELDAYIARAGVYGYRNADGSITRELIDVDQLFDATSLATLPGRPVTNEHPASMVTSRNATQHSKGSVRGDASPDGPHLAAPLMVIDEAMIADIDAGKVQVSCGYTCDVVPKSGTHDEFGPYDAVQKNRRYNHVAIVERGRHGDSVAVRIDAAVMVDDDAAAAAEATPSPAPAAPTPERTMKTLIDLLISLGKADAAEIVGDALAEERAQAHADARAKVDAQLADLQTKVDAAEGARDAIQAQLTEATAKLDEAADATPKADEMLVYANERAAILAKAETLKVDAKPLEAVAGLGELKREILKAYKGDALRADASDAYIDAAWEFIEDTPVANPDRKAMEIDPEKAREDRAEKPVKTASQTWRERVNAAHNTPKEA